MVGIELERLANIEVFIEQEDEMGTKLNSFLFTETSLTFKKNLKNF